MLHLLVVALWVFVLSWPAMIGAQTSGIAVAPCASCFCLWDSEHVSCRAFIAPMQSSTLYILARPEDYLVPTGLVGAEFRIRGKPATGLLLTAEPNPAATLAQGNPFSDETAPEGARGGANLAFAECQPSGPHGTVLLYTVTAVNVGGVTNVVLQVDRKDPPGNQNAAFPLLNACDAPIFTALAAIGGRLVINESTSVEARSWNVVKNLYR